MSLKVKHRYDFPNATIVTYRDGRVIEFPKWCLMIHSERSRTYAASALHHLRRYRRQLKAGVTHE